MTITLAQAAPPGALPIEAVHLVHGAPDAASNAADPAGLLTTSPPVWPWVVAAIMLIALVALLFHRRSNGRGVDIPTRTFRRLSRRLRLSRAERELVASLAASSSSRAHPVALLLSQDAFIRCAEGAAAASDAVADLHAKIFRVPNS